MRLREHCEALARAAGELLLELEGRAAVREKGPADLVTEADEAAQRLIFEGIQAHFPGDAVLGEEDLGDSTHSMATPTGRRWIVDPIDGTVNFVHGLRGYSVSIAVEERGVLQAGAVYDPNAEEMFSAAAGEGARLNGAAIAPSGERDFDRALVCVSLPARVSRTDPVVGQLLRVLERARSIRRLGSAALNLCYVASGRLDAYWATIVQSWDVAAGLLLCQEAGVAMSNLEGGPIELDRPKLAVASSPELLRELRELLREV